MAEVLAIMTLFPGNKQSSLKHNWACYLSPKCHFHSFNFLGVMEREGGGGGGGGGRDGR